LIGALSGHPAGDANVLRRIEKSEIDEAEREAFHHRVDCACRLAQSNRLLASFQGNVSRRILAEDDASSGVIHDPRIGETVYFWE
jgi:hypothetical protein